MGSITELTPEQVRTVYQQGVDAVVALVEGLVTVIRGLSSYLIRIPSHARYRGSRNDAFARCGPDESVCMIPLQHALIPDFADAGNPRGL